MANETSERTLAALILGVCLVIGLAAGGYFIGRGPPRFNSDPRTVTRKGLVEKQVKADQAVWALKVRRASDDLKDVQAKISADRDAVAAFLKKQGFKDEEIARQPILTHDKLAREYGQGQNERFRYVLTASVEFNTPHPELFPAPPGPADQPLKTGS